MKPIQYFSDEYLEQCQQLTSEQIVTFLDDFRQLHGQAQGRGHSVLTCQALKKQILDVEDIKALEKLK